jgi:hypothetical protein
MAEWSEDHVAAIGLFKLEIGTCVRFWINWRPDGTLRWKRGTISWKGRGVVCEKPPPSRL